MSFLGIPCSCGWACSEIDSEHRFCERCKRQWIRQSYGWEQISSREEILEYQVCRHNRSIGQKCPHCKGEIAHD